MNDCHAKAIERASLFGFIELITVWVAIADAQQFTRSGYAEVNHILSRRYDASFCIEYLYGEDSEVFGVGSDACAICMHSDAGRSTCGLAF